MKGTKRWDRISNRIGAVCLAFLALAISFAALLLCRARGVPVSSLLVVATAVSMLALGTALFLLLLHEVRFRSRLVRLLDGESVQDEARLGLVKQRPYLLSIGDSGIVDRIFERMQEFSVSRALKTEAELHALQNQINPHFLYNTLEIIRSRAMMQGNSDVAEMVEALAMLFRYCISSPGELVTLAQELDNVHDYLLIQHYRYGDRFSYQEILCDESEIVMNSKLPVMTLQPIIENAIVHGINPKIENSSITLRVEISGERMRILVEDDGVGIDDEELRRVRRSLKEDTTPTPEGTRNPRSIGIAMRNVNQRIRFYFGNSYGLDIRSTRDVGTSVIITLPWTGAPGVEGAP